MFVLPYRNMAPSLNKHFKQLKNKQTQQRVCCILSRTEHLRNVALFDLTMCTEQDVNSLQPYVTYKEKGNKKCMPLKELMDKDGIQDPSKRCWNVLMQGSYKSTVVFNGVSKCLYVEVIDDYNVKQSISVRVYVDGGL